MVAYLSQGILRTKEVVERLKSVQPTPGQKPAILVYLGVLLQKGKLNALESAELARWVTQCGPRVDYVTGRQGLSVLLRTLAATGGHAEWSCDVLCCAAAMCSTLV